MGNTIFIRRVCVKSLRSRIEAIQKLKPPMMVKECRRFVGMVNFVSIFYPELQKLLKPIYHLTRKGRHFVWGEKQQKELKKSRVDYKDHEFYICLTDKDNSNCTQTQADLLLVVHCTKFKMDSLNLLPM